MRNYQDSVEKLTQAVQNRHKAKARFRQKIFVREEGLPWEGDVYFFDLVYDTKNSGPTKEQIAGWRLPGPSAAALDAAEKRGLKIKKQLETTREKNPENRRKPKLAYAWTSPIKGSRQRKTNIVLQEGDVKSPADAVRAAMGKAK